MSEQYDDEQLEGEEENYEGEEGEDYEAREDDEDGIDEIMAGQARNIAEKKAKEKDLKALKIVKGDKTLKGKGEKKLKSEKNVKGNKVIKSNDKKTKSGAPKGTRSAKAGLVFPVGALHRVLKEQGIAPRVGSAAPVFLAAVLEYLTAEVLELAGTQAVEAKKKRILPRHIQLAIHRDEELSRYLGQTTIAQGGVLPGIPGLMQAGRR